MLSSKERAILKSNAHDLNSIFQIGKGNVTPLLVQGIGEALEARELIKINVLDNCDMELKEVATMVAERTHSEVVQIIGKKIVLFKKKKENSKYL